MSRSRGSRRITYSGSRADCAFSSEHVEFKVYVRHFVSGGSYQAVGSVAGAGGQGQGGKAIWETSAWS